MQHGPSLSPHPRRSPQCSEECATARRRASGWGLGVAQCAKVAQRAKVALLGLGSGRAKGAQRAKVALLGLGSGRAKVAQRAEVAQLGLGLF